MVYRLNNMQSGIPTHIIKPVLNQNIENSAPVKECINSFTLKPSILPVLNKTSIKATKSSVPNKTNNTPNILDITLKKPLKTV